MHRSSTQTRHVGQNLVPGLLSTVLNMWCVRPLTFIHHHVGVTENWIGYDRVHQFQANSSFPIFSVASLHSKTLRLSGHSVTLSKAMEVLPSQAMSQAKLSHPGWYQILFCANPSYLTDCPTIIYIYITTLSQAQSITVLQVPSVRKLLRSRKAAAVIDLVLITPSTTGQC